jgi:hypothetical protein
LNYQLQVTENNADMGAIPQILNGPKGPFWGTLTVQNETKLLAGALGSAWARSSILSSISMVAEPFERKCKWARIIAHSRDEGS